MVQWLRFCSPSAGGPGSILGQGTRSHMLQVRIQRLRLRICMLQQKEILHATVKIEDPKCCNEDLVEPKRERNS